MKKLKTHYAIILIITAYFLFNGCIPRQKEIVVQYGVNEFHSWELYANELQIEGYSRVSAEHIAKVEFKLLPIDEDYTALKED
jgi:hypothetical protein